MNNNGLFICDAAISDMENFIQMGLINLWTRNVLIFGGLSLCYLLA